MNLRALLPVVALAALPSCSGTTTAASTGGTTSTTENGSESTTRSVPSPDASTSGEGTTNGGESTTSPSPTTAAPPTTETTDTESGTTGTAFECPYTEVEGQRGVAFEQIAEGFTRPLLVVGHPTEPERLFVVEQGGNVFILEPGATTRPSTPFLRIDVPGANSTQVQDERGLLGLAFHPDFPGDPRLYVSYTRPQTGQATTVDEYVVNGDTPAFSRTIIAASQPQSNHNGGMIEFGPDGYLYFGLGDGGGGGDQNRYARNPSILLGKILRIGVEPDGQPDTPGQCGNCAAINATLDYTIPPDNPFVGNDGVIDEAYALGLRNPWRFSFDRVSGLLYAGDVGQGGAGNPPAREEVDLIEAGRDYGWSDMEGANCFNDDGCDTSAGPHQINADGLTSPLTVYAHGAGRCSITGLGVYRSCEVPDWAGRYYYADLCTGEVSAVRWSNDAVEAFGVVGDLPGAVLGGGYNAHGDVFVATAQAYGGPAGVGRIYRIVPGP